MKDDHDYFIHDLLGQVPLLSFTIPDLPGLGAFLAAPVSISSHAGLILSKIWSFSSVISRLCR